MRTSFRRVLISGIAVLALAACQSDEEKISDHTSRGDAYRESKDFAAAIIEYKNVLQLDPNHAQAHYALARTYLANKQTKEGFWELRESVRLDPDNIEARVQLGQLLLLARDSEEALIQSDAIIESGESMISGYLLRGQALELLKRSDEALATYEMAIESAPGDTAPLFMMAQAQVRSGDNPAAEVYFRKLIDAEPNFLAYTSFASFLAQDPTRDVETEAMFIAAADSAEADEKVRGYQNVASFFFQRERFDDATDYLEEAITKVDKPLELIYLLARLHVAQGNDAKADELVRQATEADPNDPAPYMTLSGHLGRRGDVDGALAAAERALEIDPDMVSAKLRIAEILVDTGYRGEDDAKVARGRAIVEAVLANNDPDASALMVMAKIDLAERNIDKAVENLRGAIELNPDSPQAHFVLGSALSVRGEGPAARTELARALELDPGLIEARRALARVHSSLGEHEYAVEEGRRYLKERPNAVRTRILVAQSLVILARIDEALNELNTIPEEQRNVEVLYALGRVHLNSGNPDVARGFLNGAIEQMPTHHDILRNLLRLDRAEGRFDESVARIRNAVAEDPEDADLRVLMGVVALMDERTDDAEAEFRKAIELDPSDATAYEHLARLFARTKRLDEAVVTYRDAIKIHPKDPNLHQFLALLYQFGGAEDKAIEHYEEAIKYGPHLSNSKNNLAYIYAESGVQLDRALDLAQDAKAALPDSANVADTLGWVLYKRGIPSAAISYLKEAESHSQGDASISGPVRYHLAQAYEADGDSERASEALERAISELDALAQQQRAGGGDANPEPTWAAEARTMMSRLQSGG